MHKFLYTFPSGCRDGTHWAPIPVAGVAPGTGRRSQWLAVLEVATGQAAVAGSDRARALKKALKKH